MLDSSMYFDLMSTVSSWFQDTWTCSKFGLKLICGPCWIDWVHIRSPPAAGWNPPINDGFWMLSRLSHNQIIATFTNFTVAKRLGIIVENIRRCLCASALGKFSGELLDGSTSQHLCKKPDRYQLHGQSYTRIASILGKRLILCLLSNCKKEINSWLIHTHTL